MLLEDVKSYLNITWDDNSIDQKLQGMIERGKQVIDRYGCDTYNYEQEGLPRSLLLNYVMYENSGILEEFKENYKDDLISLQIESRLKNAKVIE